MRAKIYQSLINYSKDLRQLLTQIRENTQVERSHKKALFWINIGVSYDEVNFNSLTLLNNLYVVMIFVLSVHKNIHLNTLYLPSIEFKFYRINIF